MTVVTDLAEWPTAVRECALLQDVPAAIRTDFLHRSELIEVNERQVLLTQDAMPAGIALVSEGDVEVSATSQSGQSLVLYCAGPGDLLGDIETIANMPSVATCTAMPGSTIVTMPKADFVALSDNPIIRRNLARITYHRLAFVNEMHAQNRYLPVDALICSHLITLSRHNPVIRRPQSYIAELACCSRQTVNRCLGALRDDGIVVLRKGVIEIIDPERLAMRWR